MNTPAARTAGVEPGHLLTVAEAAEELGVSVYRTRMVIADGSLTSLRVGARRYVATRAIADYQGARNAREAALRAAAPRQWDWEGNLVSTLSNWFTQRGWREVSRADTALREQGIDLVMEKDGRLRVFEVKGWPTATYQSGPKQGEKKQWRSTMGRTYVGGLVLSAMLLRSSRPDDEVAIAVPNHQTFATLLTTIRSSLEALGVGAYMIEEDGVVSTLLAVEDVDEGRLARDRQTDSRQIRHLLELSDGEREARFVASNQRGLEFLADARRSD